VTTGWRMGQCRRSPPPVPRHPINVWTFVVGSAVVLAHQRGHSERHSHEAGAAYFASRCNAKAHSRSGSRWPCFAKSIISLATSCVARSLRSTNLRAYPKRLRTPQPFWRCLPAQMNDHVRGRAEWARPAPNSTCRSREMELMFPKVK
jgi:hypothetical protein